MHGKISYEFKTINYLEQNDAKYLKTINPINKIPILIDHSEVIYDSRVIYNYLSKKYLWAPLSMKQENILSAIDAALDSSINLFSLQRGGLDFSLPNAYLTRQKERIPLLMEYLSTWTYTEHEWNFLAMSLYSYLDWASFRGQINLDQYPAMKHFHSYFKNAPGVEETQITV
jgi:glutathione S-transferase